jgi:hypothetical protein
MTVKGRRIRSFVNSCFLASAQKLFHHYTNDVWLKVEYLVIIAKRFPKLLRKERKQIDSKIQQLHEDHHSDYYNDKCGAHIDGGENTAASKGLIFPPYPFDD